MKNTDERLRHQLEIQSIQIEEFLNRHDVPAEVAGGTVRSRWVNFDLNTQISTGLDKLRHLGRELAANLGASDVTISQLDDRLRIAIKQPKTHPVDLLDLLELVPENSQMTAALGLDVAERPVLLNLLADDIVNILIAGEVNAGKTALLRTIALSLALQNKQSQVQMAIFDLGQQKMNRKNKPSLYPLNYLPHVMFNVIEEFREASEALAFLVSEASYRIEQQVTWPVLILLIDNVNYLVEAGGKPIIDPLTYLLEEGVNSGIRVVLAAENPESKELRPLLKNSSSVRLVGQVADENMARAFTGIQDSQAEYLMGEGDFIAVSNGMVLPFQAAFLNDYDLHLILDKLHRQNQQVMLAQPMMIRPTTMDFTDIPEQPQSFEFNSQDRRASLNSKPVASASKIIESTTRSNDSGFENQSEEIEEDYLEEEAYEAHEDWQDDDPGSEEDEAVVNVWSGPIQRPIINIDNNGWDADEDEDDLPVEVWSTPNKAKAGDYLTTGQSEEIEFGWE